MSGTPFVNDVEFASPKWDPVPEDPGASSSASISALHIPSPDPSSTCVPSTVLLRTSGWPSKFGYELDLGSAWEKFTAIPLYLRSHQQTPYTVTLPFYSPKFRWNPRYLAWGFLFLLRRHVLAEIEAKFADKAFFHCHKQEYVISVPAHWDEKSVQILQEAATMAGLSSVEIVRDPEAVIMYRLTMIKSKGYRVGDVITVCDVGGRTTNLSTYEIQSLDPPAMTSCAASRMDKAVPYQVSRTTIFHGQNLRYCRHVFLTGGAIMLKLGIAPIARPTVAPASYGIMVSAPMDPVRDNNKPWYVDVLSQEHRCNIMEWFMSYVSENGRF
ncbi:unnamed protein product [Parascedosporium putredinis]|uniref:Uncharacterized protein n=1 Tax=Parascedosporium putredinis TaxID=1442378 RepID=A0A9P1H0E5_9PEZI|nr:unnamed protein product [Parascedosporium putredinis]CAI7991703.1 unnamed protein product [Parascedosporium putredinis]